MTEHEQLANSPLIEAVLDLRVKASKPYSLIPGGIEQALSKRFPKTVETEAAKLLGLVGQLPPSPAFFATHQFKSVDEKRLVQIAPNGLVVNDLAYIRFADFVERAQGILKEYFSVAAVESVQRIGLRYINRIRPGQQFLDGLCIRWDWPAPPHSKMESLTSRATFQFTAPPGQLGVVVGAANPEDATTLDLDFATEPKRRMSVEEVIAWATSAHDRLYETFRAVVSPNLYTFMRGNP